MLNSGNSEFKTNIENISIKLATMITTQTQKVTMTPTTKATSTTVAMTTATIKMRITVETKE